MIESLPNRQSIRKGGWDYTAPGWYFITINTKGGQARLPPGSWGGQALFGTIVNRRMVLSEAGRVAEACWREIPAHFPSVQIDEFVIMPNHVHGVVRILQEGLDAGGGFDISNQCSKPQFGKPIAGALGTVVGAYKAAVSRGLACQTRPACQAHPARPAAGAS